MRLVVDTDLKRRYERALRVCTINLENESGLDHSKSALCFFRLGIVLSRLKEIENSIRCFSDAFLLRDSSFIDEAGPQWKDFHKIQMSRYIYGKRKKSLSSLAEGDMIHDLIKNRYLLLLEEIKKSEIPFAATNINLYFESIKIDFPWDMEDLRELSRPTFN
jgi:hypothetical protein